MATSRSRAGVVFISRSPIRSSPPVISSRPATMRNAVDFPHPDGPTSTMNSPSWISRLRASTALFRVPARPRRHGPGGASLVGDLDPRPAGLGPDPDGHHGALLTTRRVADGVGQQLAGDELEVVAAR